MENTNINEKSKIVKLMISIIILIVIALVGTYALTIWRSQENTELTLRIGDISGFYCTKGDNIEISNIGPIFDYTIDGESTTFSVDNQTNEVAKVSVKFHITTLTDNLKEDSFKYVLMTNVDNSSYTVYTEGNFKDVTNGSSITLLDNYEVALSSKVSFKLVIYIDGNMENPITMQGGSLVGYLDACKEDGGGDIPVNDGANAPELVQGLIPVTYNESTSSWVKADSTNTGGSWYNYDNKKWANAVLVKENGIVFNPTEKNVNIPVNLSVEYVSNSQGEGNYAASLFIINTGNTPGTLSFSYSAFIENGDNMYFTVDEAGATIYESAIFEESVTDTYTVNAKSNTEYVITVSYNKYSNNDDYGKIYDIVIPSGATMKVDNSDEYVFEEKSSYKIGNNFMYNNGKYIITNTVKVDSLSNSVGKYMCEDTVGTECTKMYEIIEASANITKIKEYTNSSVNTYVARQNYQSASVGTKIPMDDILAFYVWIPRYKYKVWNKDKVIGTDSYNAQTTGIDIVFESGTSSTGTISCTYSYASPSSSAGSPNETCTGSNGDYYTHPAFTFGSQELTGFWMGKFELSSSNPQEGESFGGGNSTTLTPRILPNVTSWRSNAISNYWKVIYDMQKGDNIYGLSTSRTNTDSHMLTNMEWGAVAYLTNSKYGRCTNGSCTEVTINNCSSYTTGIGGDIVSGSNSSTTCTTAANKYNGAKGVLASTTGNIYGVYDMSGGTYEYVMGNMSSSNDTTYIYNAGGAGSNFTYSTDTAKYITTYAYGKTSNDQAAYNRSRLGDATGEIMVLSSGSSNGWYNGYAVFPYHNPAEIALSWFERGCGYDCNSYASVFEFDITYGDDGGLIASTRAVITTS